MDKWKDSDIMKRILDGKLPKQNIEALNSISWLKDTIITNEKKAHENELKGHKIHIAGLSVNQAYTGRRFKTEKYRQWKRKLMLMFPVMPIPTPPIEMHYIFGLSSVLSDVDGCIKSFQDCLCEYYGFDDRYIYKITVEKRKVEKGSEYIWFDIKKYKP